MKYKIGDKIKIIKEGKFDWNKIMNAFIGKTFTISKIFNFPTAPGKKVYNVLENNWSWYEDSFILSTKKIIREYGIVRFMRSIEKK